VLTINQCHQTPIILHIQVFGSKLPNIISLVLDTLSMVIHYYYFTGPGGEGEMEMPIRQWLRWQVDSNFSLVKDLSILALLIVPGMTSWAPTGISMDFIN